MKNQIIKKLAAVLAGRPIDDEIRVVYLLAQTRKILEHEDAQTTIKFYCNWALHINLVNESAQSFLKEILPRLSWQRRDDESCQVADRLLTLTAFRDELRTFLVDHDLDPTMCVKDDQWISFLAAYSRVVEDSPLEVKPEKLLVSIKTDINIKMPERKVKPMEILLQSLCIKALPCADRLSCDRPFPMKWVIKYKEKETGHRCGGALSMSSRGVTTKQFTF
jgi:hypothetical protein